VGTLDFDKGVVNFVTMVTNRTTRKKSEIMWEGKRVKISCTFPEKNKKTFFSKKRMGHFRNVQNF
jgi:hypothetical protein